MQNHRRGGSFWNRAKTTGLAALVAINSFLTPNINLAEPCTIYDKTHTLPINDSNGKPLKTEEIRVCGILDNATNVFSVSVFTKKYSHAFWWSSEDEKVPLYARHTSINPTHMGTIVLHPTNLEIGEVKQWGHFISPTLKRNEEKAEWKEMVPYDEAGLSKFAEEKGTDIIKKMLAKTLILGKCWDDLVDICAKQNAAYYENIFPETAQTTATMIPFYTEKNPFNKSLTAWHCEIPLKTETAADTSTVAVWINPAFGNPSENYNNGSTAPVGYGRLEGITMEFQVERKTPDEIQDRKKEYIVDLGDGVKIEMLPVEVGEFREYNQESIAEGPRRIIQIPYRFFMAKTEITNEQYRKFNPRHNSGLFEGHPLDKDDQPMVNGSGKEMGRFCDWLTQRVEKGVFRLPTEKEWIYVAKGGRMDLLFPVGFGPQHKIGNYKYNPNGYPKISDGFIATAPVGLFAKHPWGFFDLGGNVSEMCENGIYKGGSFEDKLSESKTSGVMHEGDYTQNTFRPDVGFRVVYVPSEPKEKPDLKKGLHLLPMEIKYANREFSKELGVFIRKTGSTQTRSGLKSPESVWFEEKQTYPNNSQENVWNLSNGRIKVVDSINYFDGEGDIMLRAGNILIGDSEYHAVRIRLEARCDKEAKQIIDKNKIEIFPLFSCERPTEKAVESLGEPEKIKRFGEFVNSVQSSPERSYLHTSFGRGEFPLAFQRFMPKINPLENYVRVLPSGIIPPSREIDKAVIGDTGWNFFRGEYQRTIEIGMKHIKDRDLNEERIGFVMIGADGKQGPSLKRLVPETARYLKRYNAKD